MYVCFNEQDCNRTIYLFISSTVDSTLEDTNLFIYKAF